MLSLCQACHICFLSLNFLQDPRKVRELSSGWQNIASLKTWGHAPMWRVGEERKEKGLVLPCKKLCSQQDTQDPRER